MKKKKVIWVILLIFFALIFIVSAVILVKNYYQNNDYKKYKKPEVSSEVTSSKEPVLVDNPIDFASLQAQNPDVCGYIRIENTVVDYPILRSAEDEPEDFYLNHDWLKKSKFAGAIYMQRLNSKEFDDPCTVLYGHNMKNGTMFGEIRKKYKDKAFFDSNRYIYIYAPGHIYKYEVFSAATYDNRHLLKSFDFRDKGDYEHFIEEIIHPKNLSAHNEMESIKPTKDDKIIVLSTCVASESQRYLVSAKLVEDTLTK